MFYTGANETEGLIYYNLGWKEIRDRDMRVASTMLKDLESIVSSSTRSLISPGRGCLPLAEALRLDSLRIWSMSLEFWSTDERSGESEYEGDCFSSVDFVRPQTVYGDIVVQVLPVVTSWDIMVVS